MLFLSRHDAHIGIIIISPYTGDKATFRKNTQNMFVKIAFPSGFGGSMLQ